MQMEEMQKITHKNTITLEHAHTNKQTTKQTNEDLKQDLHAEPRIFYLVFRSVAGSWMMGL